ncbi:hypothetical protein Ciccas_014420, partial [Cichlidogyrus casuarinus]
CVDYLEIQANPGNESLPRLEEAPEERLCGHMDGLPRRQFHSVGSQMLLLFHAQPRPNSKPSSLIPRGFKGHFQHIDKGQCPFPLLINADGAVNFAALRHLQPYVVVSVIDGWHLGVHSYLHD